MVKAVTEKGATPSQSTSVEDVPNTIATPDLSKWTPTPTLVLPVMPSTHTPKETIPTPLPEQRERSTPQPSHGTIELKYDKSLREVVITDKTNSIAIRPEEGDKNSITVNVRYLTVEPTTTETHFYDNMDLHQLQKNLSPLLEKTFGERDFDLDKIAAFAAEKLDLEETPIQKVSQGDFKATVNDLQTEARITRGQNWVRFYRQKGGGLKISTNTNPKPLTLEFENRAELLNVLTPHLDAAFGKLNAERRSLEPEIKGIYENLELGQPLRIDEGASRATIQKGDKWLSIYRLKGGKSVHVRSSRQDKPIKVTFEGIQDLSLKLTRHIDKAFGKLDVERRSYRPEIEELYGALGLGAGARKDPQTIDYATASDGLSATFKQNGNWLTVYRLKDGGVNVRYSGQDKPIKIDFEDRLDLSNRLTPHLDKTFGTLGVGRESVADEVKQMYSALNLKESRRKRNRELPPLPKPVNSLYGSRAQRNQTLYYVINRLKNSGRYPIENSKEREQLKRQGVLVQLKRGPGIDIDRQEIAPKRRVVLPEVRDYLKTLGRDFTKKFGGRKLLLNSALRETSYNNRISSVGALSPHPYGAAVDISVFSLSRAERTWLDNRLLTDEKAGKIEAIRERHPPHYHVVVFKD